jgi:hypothetical protein
MFQQWSDPEFIAKFNAIMDEMYGPKPGAKDTIQCTCCDGLMLETWRYCQECGQPREILHYQLLHRAARTEIDYTALLQLAQDETRAGSRPDNDIHRDIVLYREVTKRQRQGWAVVDADDWIVTMVGRKQMSFELGALRILGSYIQSRQTANWEISVDEKLRLRERRVG